MAIASHGMHTSTSLHLDWRWVHTGGGWLEVRTDGLKTSRGHIGCPKPDIVKASVSAKTMTDILESIGLAPSDGSTAIPKWFVW